MDETTNTEIENSTGETKEVLTDGLSLDSDSSIDEMIGETSIETEETDTETPAIEEEATEEKIEFVVETEEGDEFELELDYLEDDKQEEKLWQARTGLNYDTLAGAVETIIFMSEKPIQLVKIKNLIDEDMPLRIIHEAIERLQGEYETGHHGIRLVEVAEGYQFRTKATYSRFVQKAYKVEKLVLSPTALEVLAICAYKQPVSKIEIDKIRGVDSGHIVRGLMDKRLVKVAGRSDEVGRPVLYGTTPEFLEVFNLADISALPAEHELEEMIAAGVGKISDIKTICQSDDKDKFIFDEMEELEALTETIKEIQAETEFTKSLKDEAKRANKEVKEGEEPVQRRSAFDLLEEYVTIELQSKINREASESELFSATADPQVISNLEEGPFNTPESMEEEEEFQMIDLDTGLPILDDEFASEEHAETIEASDDLPAIPEEEIILSGADILGLAEEKAAEPRLEDMILTGDQILASDADAEARELSKALDDAFTKLTGETLEDDEIEMDLSEEETLADLEEELEEVKKEMVNEANDLDIDLSFLNETLENTSPEGETDSE